MVNMGAKATRLKADELLALQADEGHQLRTSRGASPKDPWRCTCSCGRWARQVQVTGARDGERARERIATLAHADHLLLVRYVEANVPKVGALIGGREVVAIEGASEPDTQRRSRGGTDTHLGIGLSLRQVLPVVVWSPVGKPGLRRRAGLQSWVVWARKAGLSGE